jgi:hypothetical protein
MKTYLFFNYYRDSNKERKEELLMCANTNAHLPFIDNIVIFLEDAKHKRDIKYKDRTQFVTLNRRMEFNDVFEYAQQHVPDDSLIIIINLDIFLENSKAWQNIEQEFFNVGHADKALVCCRHNLNENLKIWVEEESWERGEFCDAWIMKTPINPEFLKEDTKFCVGGAPQCDNVMMYLMSKYYHVYSWGSKYKIFHYDVARKRESKTELILNDKTDYRPSERKSEQVMISAFQDNERFLREGTRPQVIPSHREVYMKGETVFVPL